jgi:hypothetical protein
MSEQPNKLDAAPLVQGLIAKSIAGKLDWQPTADRRAFVTSVGGDTTFRILRGTETELNEYGQPEDVYVPELHILDAKGQVLWEVYPRDVPPHQLDKLFETARRIGNRLDERLSKTLEALERL